jgi:hypothetical protein
MTRTPKDWKDLGEQLALLDTGDYWADAIRDIQELADQLRVYREAWEARAKYVESKFNNSWHDWDEKEQTVRRMRGKT